MNIFDVLYTDYPAAAFRINFASATSSDVYGGSDSLVATTTPLKAAPLVSGSAGSAKLSSTNTAYMTLDRFSPGKEKMAFSLEAWVKFNTFSGNISILSHDGIYDGLWSDGNHIRFKVNFVAGSTEVKWPLPDATDAYHVVGTYSRNKIELFVNGESVAEEEIPEAQQASQFSAVPNTRVYAGQSPGAERILLDVPAYYRHALSPHSVRSHFVAGRQNLPYLDNVSRYGGTAWGLWDGERETEMKVGWVDQNDWKAGVYSNVSFSDGNLAPEVDAATGQSRAGTWKVSVPLDATLNTSLGGAKVSWDADGAFSVDTSLDNGATWTPLTNGSVAAGTFGLNTTGKTLDVRVSFVGSIVDDISVVRNLSVVVYRSATVTSLLDSSRTLTIGGSTPPSTSSQDNEPIEQNDMSGAKMPNNAWIVAPPDATESPRNVQTIEMWAKMDSIVAGWQYFFDARTPTVSTHSFLVKNTTGNTFTSQNGTFYLNGVATASGSVAVQAGEWYHLVVVMTTPVNTDVHFGRRHTNVDYMQGQIGMIATYPGALTASQVATLYNSYSSIPTVNISDTNPIVVSEPGNSLTMYAHEWSIQGGS